MQIKEYLYFLITDQREGFIASIIKGVLLVLSFLYGFVVRLISFSYGIGILKKYRPKCKVISVGNITWGGTGKTPMIEALVKFLKEKGHNVAILSRGYKSSKTKKDDESEKNADSLGDESYLLTQKFPDILILVGRDRKRNAKEALRQYNIDTIILDDGFQHWSMYRDLDIVMIDAINPFGNAHLLPRGILREPLETLRRAQIFVLTKTDLEAGNLSYIKDRLSKINPKALMFESTHTPLGFYDTKNNELPLSFIQDKNVCLVSSIADPESFKRTVSRLGAKISLVFSFPDHHKYSEDDIRNIRDNCLRLGVDNVVTTEKDIVKLSPLSLIQDFTPSVITLRIKLDVTQDKKFYDRLLSLYHS